MKYAFLKIFLTTYQSETNFKKRVLSDGSDD